MHLDKWTENRMKQKSSYKQAQNMLIYWLTLCFSFGPDHQIMPDGNF